MASCALLEGAGNGGNCQVLRLRICEEKGKRTKQAPKVANDAQVE